MPCERREERKGKMSIHILPRGIALVHDMFHLSTTSAHVHMYNIIYTQNIKISLQYVYIQYAMWGPGRRLVPSPPSDHPSHTTTPQLFQELRTLPRPPG